MRFLHFASGLRLDIFDLFLCCVGIRNLFCFSFAISFRDDSGGIVMVF